MGSEGGCPVCSKKVVKMTARGESVWTLPCGHLICSVCEFQIIDSTDKLRPVCNNNHEEAESHDDDLIENQISPKKSNLEIAGDKNINDQDEETEHKENIKQAEDTGEKKEDKDGWNPLSNFDEFEEFSEDDHEYECKENCDESLWKLEWDDEEHQEDFASQLEKEKAKRDIQENLDYID